MRRRLDYSRSKIMRFGMRALNHCVAPVCLFAALLTSALAGCGVKETPTGIDLQGEVEGFAPTSAIISRVTNQPYDQLVPLDTVDVLRGHFEWRCDTLPYDVYALSFVSEGVPNENSSVYALLGDGRVKMRVARDREGVLSTRSVGSEVQAQYERFMEEYRKVSRRDEIDSLEHAFFSARERGDTVAALKIKEASKPLYTESAMQIQRYLRDRLKDTVRNFFTLYLYYTHDLATATIERLGQLDSIRARLGEWKGTEEQGSRLMRSALLRCDLASRSVEGALAPEIVGVRPNGDTLRLSSLRGRWVLVDFWASYCGWCRQELPLLRAAYERYGKAGGVSFVSVSLDKNDAAWRRALEEEKMPWDNIRIEGDLASRTITEYNISGIPLAILIDGEGRIARRGIRGAEMIEVLAGL